MKEHPVLGFTGTQLGMTRAQRCEFNMQLINLKSPEFHHGDCIGADADAHNLVRGFPSRLKIVIHPPNIAAKRAFMVSGHVLSTKPYLKRNHDIVDACDVLIATPKGKEEELRSGTWATVRYARKTGKPVIIIYPDGSTKVEEN